LLGPPNKEHEIRETCIIIGEMRNAHRIFREHRYES